MSEKDDVIYDWNTTLYSHMFAHLRVVEILMYENGS